MTAKTLSKPETHNFGAEVDKIFKLMIHSIYENKDIFLRELVANASDACDKLRYQALTQPELLEGDSQLYIHVAADAKKKTLTIRDNGIGMTRDELMQNLGTIARSGTQKFLESLEQNQQKNAQMIGQFGVGFYASFMVADHVRVVSRAAGQAESFVWESNGDSQFTIRSAEDAEKLTARGTVITLKIRKDDKEFLDFFRLRHIIQTYCGHTAFDITLVNDDGKEEVVNDGKALWLKDKKDISAEEYQDFYRSISHMGMDAPWMTLHHKMEGATGYTSLLYIPSARPFDLFHPDRETRVKLYIKRVFIAEHGVELIPQYLRFLRGVVDSDDLPLNISRETVQNSGAVHTIRKSITKKILSELQKKADKAPEDYEKFWANFGQVLKEGLCDGMEPREELLDTCRFYSTASEGKLISLKDYISRMKADQKAIYFITGQSRAAVQNSPQLEGFRARGLEVLLLTDSVDEFWVNVVSQYRETPLKSVTRASTELDDLPETAAKNLDAKEESAAQEIAPLLDKMKAVLGEKIREVRTTKRLTDSPVCLTVPEGAMDIRMERYLVENKQLPGISPRILEINATHPIITALARDVNGAEVPELIQLLFAQANIAEGEPVEDIGSFIRQMNAMIARAIAS